MKSKMLLAASLVAPIILGACSSIQAQTPAAVADRVCPVLTAQLQTLSLAGIFTGGAADTLDKSVVPIVDAVCAAGAQVTVVNVQKISSAAVPLLVSMVNLSVLPADQKLAAVAAIGLVKGAIDGAFPPTVATSAAAATSAPIAASSAQ
ncbi:hypothetical protein [Burkholderia gladioli]|uniref:hypothetical protein n=1 Tax=Burkholderia gladioli TaxID=28095 RepID=UPI00163FB1C0|nr:hypothetical protein [Burkholderia gladioli]